MAAGKKTGGRQKGTPNRATAAKVAEVKASGLAPLDFLLARMRDEGEDIARRIDCAKAAAQYVHPKLQSIESKTQLTGKDGEPLLPRRVEVVPLGPTAG